MFKKEFWVNGRFRKITASLFLLAVFLCLSFLGSGAGITYESTVPDTEKEDEGILYTEEQGNFGEKMDSPEMIFVDVIGCVENPGVYQLPAGSRVFQAIEMAGGMTEDAEVKSINRAALLSDEQVVTILSVEEYEKRLAEQGGIGFMNGKVDLNSADSTALESLSGIGPSMAQRILEYRDSHGRFTKIEDLMNIDGIGQKTFERLKDSICVQ